MTVLSDDCNHDWESALDQDCPGKDQSFDKRASHPAESGSRQAKLASWNGAQRRGNARGRSVDGCTSLSPHEVRGCLRLPRLGRSNLLRSGHPQGRPRGGAASICSRLTTTSSCVAWSTKIRSNVVWLGRWFHRESCSSRRRFCSRRNGSCAEYSTSSGATFWWLFESSSVRRPLCSKTAKPRCALAPGRNAEWISPTHCTSQVQRN